MQTLPPEAESSVDKNKKSRELKYHLEYDVQEINIKLEFFSESKDLL